MPPRIASIATALALFALAACSRHHQAAAPQPNLYDDTAPSPSAASVSRGRALFVQVQCSACHGAEGAGGPVGPPLRGERRRKATNAVVAAIAHPTPPMPKLFPAKLSAQDVADLAAYVETL